MGKRLIFEILEGRKTERAGWVPFAGVHSGFLTDYSAKEVLQNGDKLLESLLKVNQLYKPDGQPVIFDLQVEAEILGCDLLWAEDAPPTVISHPLEATKELPCDCMMPTKEDGRLPMILKVMEQMKKEVGEHTALYGLLCGPFTLASHLRGTQIFMDMFDDEEYLKRLMNYTTKINKKLSDYYIEAGMDVIAYVDPLVSQISKDHFNQFLAQPYSELFDYLKSKEIYSSFFVCGDATKNIEVMCQTKPDSISVDENIDLVEAKKITDEYEITIGGNIPLTTVMLHGSQKDNMKYVVDLLEELNTTKNLMIAPGCDMPYNTPIENSIAVQQAIAAPEKVKKMLKDYESTLDLEGIAIELPEYKNLKKPLLEVFTLDSATCAACGYMMNVANKVKDQLGDAIQLEEYKYTSKENIARCMKMGVKNLPSMYINGELKYSSIIPGEKELIKTLKESL